jgi:hypothetical protein
MAVDAEHAAFLAKPVAVEIEVVVLMLEIWKVEMLMLEILMFEIPIVAATVATRMIASPVAVTEAAG